MNVDYKILSACLANRLKRVLPDIISSSQKGFLKERFIGENTRLVLDIMQHLEEQEKSGMILLADFEKAFDSIEWPYITKLLNVYNFGPSFSKWVSTLYNRVESCVINNGHFSQFFKLGRGCRQGDPLSPYIFILAIEPLAIALKNNKDIKGITLGGIEYKLGMYADDTFLLLDGNDRSLRITMDIFKRFQLCSGLKLNVEKTQAAWLGERRGSPDRLCADIALNWTTSFTLLGIKFTTLDVNACLELNLEDKIKEISKMLRQYQRRNLSLIGRVTVIKTLAIPKLVHILTVLPNPNLQFINTLNEVFSTFLWNNKKGKINRNLMAQALEEGGLKLTHIQSQISALKIRWARYLLIDASDWVNIFQDVTGYIDCDRILSLDPKSLLHIAKRTRNIFWREVLQAWARLVEVIKIDEATKILQFSLWDSWYLQNENLKFIQDELVSFGCVNVGDLFDETMNILSYNEFCDQFVQINFLDYASLVTSLPTEWKMLLSGERLRPEAGTPELLCQIIMNPKTCRFAYKCFIESLPRTKPHELKWSEKGINISEEEDWRMYNNLPFKCTMSTKLQAFQYKIIHRILGTGTLKKMCNIVGNDDCTFCAGQPETLLHLFVECAISQSFWIALRTWLNTYLNLPIDPRSIMFGDTRSFLISHVILAAKYYIFLCQIKKQPPCLTAFKAILRTEYATERYIAKQSTRETCKFREKWEPIQNLLI